jgi:ectoine hydroxylase-related dioxygenase (phytanoyl-CoA dioxygenase family)
MIDAATIDQFQEDGAVCLRQVFAPYWIDLLAAGVERNLSEPGPFGHRYPSADGRGLFFGDYCSWRRIPEYEEFLRSSPAASLAAQCMGSKKVNLFHEHVLVKEPGTPNPTPWHHDMPYWTVEGRQVCSLWIPLDEVDRETAVEYVLGSHRWGEWYTPKRFADGDDHPDQRGDRLKPVPDIDAMRDRLRIGGWAVEPGDCIVFDALTLHGAPGNFSQNRRRAFAARWTGDDVVYSLREGLMSPPPHAFPGAPEPGAAMDSDAFPVVWHG